MKKTKLKSMIKEDNNIINEGIGRNIIASILKLIYSGKTKEAAPKIAKINDDLAKNIEILDMAINNINNIIRDPKNIELFKNYGVDLNNLSTITRSKKSNG